MNIPVIDTQLFSNRFASPLRTAIGQKLTSVTYWVHEVDIDTFDIEVPNDSGLIAISLELPNRSFV